MVYHSYLERRDSVSRCLGRLLRYPYHTVQNPAKKNPPQRNIGLDTKADFGEKQKLFEGTPGGYAWISARVSPSLIGPPLFLPNQSFHLQGRQPVIISVLTNVPSKALKMPA